MYFLFSFFILAILIQLYYYLFIFRKLFHHKDSLYSPDILPSISVVICAKNEAANLKQNLKIILSQNYKNYEVVLVNDRSTDDSATILEEYKTRNAHLKVITIFPDESAKYLGKRDALLRGVEAASYERIVVTDADCKPTSANWISSFAKAYNAETELVLGYAPFISTPSFLNILARFENILTGTLYLSFAKTGKAIFGTGRNYSFRKSTFLKENDFENATTLGGDDDLFINRISTKENTQIILESASFQYSNNQQNWKDFFEQKLRHSQAGWHYPWLDLVKIHAFNFSLFLVYFLFFISLFLRQFQIVPIFLCFVLFESIFRIYLFKLFHQKIYPFMVPFLSFIFLGYGVFLFLLPSVKTKISWK